jgi:hypothetical protein
MIRVLLPPYLRSLVNANDEVTLTIEGDVTIRILIDMMEKIYPMLRGTVRDYATQQRRAYLRFYACKEDYSLHPLDTILPKAVLIGEEPFIILGSIAGG